MDTYLLKFSACLLVFWLVYILVLERQRMHIFKRFYLLGAFVVSLTIPLLTITEYIEPIAKTLETSTIYFPMEMVEEMPIEEPPLLTLENILWIIYGLGVLAFGLRFIINISKLYRRIIKNEKVKQRFFIYVLLKDYQIPHSFFRYIFLNKLRFNDKAIPKEVLAHEEAHAKQLHSLDIVIIEFLQIIFWFHPLIYILKHHIKLNHEFMADQAVLKQGSDTKTYQNILLQFSSSGTYHLPNAFGMTSAINYSSIKKRFTVMKTQTSKTRVWLSTFLLLPIVAILFYSFAEREYVEKESPDLIESIKKELEEAEKLNIVYVDGATEKMMKEYNDWINEFKRTQFINNSTYQRIVAIYEIMNETQRNSVEKYPDVPNTNLSKVIPKKPTSKQLEAFKNDKEYAIWIDGKHVQNSTLNNYTVEDFVHHTGSKVYKNARSEKFPQPYQYHLYTKDGFKKTYQESQVKKYKVITNKYSTDISEYLKGNQTDNSELKILKAQADKIYNSFSKEELKKHKILPPPPVPAEKTSKHVGSKSKGGPNVSDTQEFYNPSFLEYIIEMEKEGALFYLNGKKISVEKAKEHVTNHQGKRTEMTTQRDKNGNYIVKLSTNKTKKIYARNIDLEVLNEGSYVIDGIRATKNTFVNIFNQLHQDISYEDRNRVMNIHVTSPKTISDKEVWFIYNSLQDYGFYRIVTPNQEINKTKGNTPVAIKNYLPKQQKLPTTKQIEAYNAWAKPINKKMAHAEKKAENEKWNFYPIVKTKDVKKHKAIYDRMTEAQKKDAEPWPNFPPPPPPPPIPENAKPQVKKKMQKVIGDYEKTYKRQVHTDKIDETGETINVIANDEVYNPETLQQKATKKEVNAYNTWAKKMTKAIKESGLGEYKGDEYPFFDMDEYLKYSKIYRRLMTPEQRKSAQPFPKLLPPPPPPPPPAPEVPSKSKKGENDIPPTPTPNSAYEYVKSLKNNEITYFFNEKKVSYKEILKIVKDEANINMITDIKDNKGTVKFWTVK